MYKHLLRPLLFKIAPETIHHLIVGMLRIIHYIPGGRLLMRACFTVRHPSLEREVFGLRFPNPIGLAAGFDKDAEVYDEIAALGFGFVEVGTITPKPQPGNPRPRLFRLPKDQALINRMGFNNHGLENAVRNLRRRNWYDPYRHKPTTLLGGNLGKNTLTPNEAAPADYLRLFRRLYEYVNYFVINVSCPNVANLAHLQDKDNLHQILRGLVEFRRGQNQYRPILLKISPDLTQAQIDDMIDVMMECGIDGIVATNTTTSREGLQTSPEVIEHIGKGGLSGKPLTKRSLEIVRYIHEKTQGNFPIIGVGGIMTPDDALAMLDAGACLIQVYTGFIYNGPGFVRKICKRLKQRAEQAATIQEAKTTKAPETQRTEAAESEATLSSQATKTTEMHASTGTTGTVDALPSEGTDATAVSEKPTEIPQTSKSPMADTSLAIEATNTPAETSNTSGEPTSTALTPEPSAPEAPEAPDPTQPTPTDHKPEA